MVYVQLLGGLGNQMFQYAAAYALASSHQTRVKLDISEFESYKLRKFDLEVFNTDFEAADDGELSIYPIGNRMFRVLEKFKPVQRKSFYKEPFFHFDESFFDLTPPVYIKGYFQSEKYFVRKSAKIRELFSFRPEAIKDVLSIATRLKEEDSVSIHIRKGDYKNEVAMKVHGILTIDYYKEAINKMELQLDDPKFYVFSDDLTLDASLFHPNATMVSGLITKTHFEDMFLMSQCRNNVIANSSFSWWAAWLNNNPNKIVTGPQRWFSDGPKDTYDILPANWIKI